MVALLSSAFIALSLVANFATSAAVINADARDVVSTETYTVGEYTITSVTRPVDKAQLETLHNDLKTSHVPLTPLEKRANINACPASYGAACRNITPAAPLAADCNALQNGLFALANQAAASAAPPCNNPQNCNCPNFSVQPGFQRTFTTGTCSFTLVNFEPPTGADTIFDTFASMGGFVVPVFNACVTAQHTTGGFAVPATASGQAIQFALA